MSHGSIYVLFTDIVYINLLVKWKKKWKKIF